MRVAAVGWLASTEAEAMDLATAQAEVSHDHPDAVSAAQAVALAIFLLRQTSNLGPFVIASRQTSATTCTQKWRWPVAASIFRQEEP